MTDRVKGFTVTLEHDIRIDDVEPLLQAIRCLRGVAHVEPSIREPGDFIIDKRTKEEIRNKMYEFIKENL